MSGELSGKKIAFLLTNGVEQPELTEPWKAIQDAGGEPVLVSPEDGQITAMKGDWDHADSFDVDVKLDSAQPGDYAGLVLPGGTINADVIRADDDAVAFVKSFLDSGKTVAAICHAPWILIEAGAVDGRRLTSFGSLETDLKNAGAKWVDEEVVVDNGIITSRNPDDLDAFGKAIVEAFAS